MTDSSKTKQRLSIHVSRKTFQDLDFIARNKKETIEKYITRLIRNSIKNYYQSEKFKKQLNNWKFPRILEATPTEKYSLIVRFNDGLEGEYLMKEIIKRGGAFTVLEDIEIFRKVLIGHNGSFLSWPYEIEIDAESIFWSIWGIDDWRSK